VSPWWVWAPEIIVAAGWVIVVRRRGVLRRRRATPAPPLITGRLEAHVAVGSLSGIAPADIKAHVLIVVAQDGGLAISGTCADPLKAFVVASASAALAARAFEAHAREGGGAS
jgi:hypothetical protein